MPNTILSPNMSLPVPVVGVDPGPQYASDINSALTIIDAHSHAAGSGVLITPAAININSALTLNNNLLTSIQALTLVAQSTDAGIYSIFSKGVDFYLTDGNSNVIRLTQSGSIAGSTGTITGLPSGTASASFAASTFTFQSATNTAASVDGRDHIFRLSTASSNALTLSPPAGLSGGSYQLYLPTIPASTSFITVDSSGNMGSSVPYPLGGNDIESTVNFPGTPTVGSRTIVTSNTGEILTVIRGRVTTASSGSGAGFTWTRTGATINVNFNTFFTDVPAVTASTVPGSNPPGIATIGNTNGSLTVINTFDITGTGVNYGVCFIAIGVR